MKINSLVFLVLLSVNVVADEAPKAKPSQQIEGGVFATEKAEYIHLTIQGKVAEYMFKKLKVKEETKRTGSLFVSKKSGDDVTCTFVAEVASVYSCNFKMDESNGKLEKE